MCLLRLPESENDLKHSLQVNGFSPKWVLRWVLSSEDWENDLEHSLQINGLSPEGVLRCLLRLPESEDDLKHSLQANGFSIYAVIAGVLFSACWDPLWWIKIIFLLRWQMQWLQVSAC